MHYGSQDNIATDNAGLGDDDTSGDMSTKGENVWEENKETAQNVGKKVEDNTDKVKNYAGEAWRRPMEGDEDKP
jgi:hypothetical protein